MSTYSMIKNALDASSIRGRVISNNIANINTKGYKKKVVNFEENLNDEIDKLQMKKEDIKHLDDKNSGETYTIEEDKSTSMRTDGNNVDIDIEKTNQAANTLMYNALINQLNNRISERRVVVNGR